MDEDDTSDWRAQLRPATRKRNFNRIMKTLKTSHFSGDEDGFLELQKIAQSFEEKTHAGATSKSDYSKKITSKLRLMESEFQKSQQLPYQQQLVKGEFQLQQQQQQQQQQHYDEESDWRVQLHPDSRHRIVNKILDTLRRHLPVSGSDGLRELRKIAQRFEEKIFTAAISQSDYLRKISLKMLTMETKHQVTISNNLPLDQAGPSNKPPDTD